MLTAMQAADILGMSGIAQAKQRMDRTICPVRVKFPRTFAAGRTESNSLEFDGIRTTTTTKG